LKVIAKDTYGVINSEMFQKKKTSTLKQRKEVQQIMVRNALKFIQIYN
jgi:hypothetical protein